ncbi:MAG: pyridoxal phosphate-dependent aminotransferase family protein [Chitinophagaceae bacterium]|nr:pyridoxal phosphate-dependent aminotransferase family protein [Oligoflexus sp.]
MKQRVKRYLPKSESSIELQLGQTSLSGLLVDISLSGLSFLTSDDVGSIEDEVGKARLKVGTEIFEIGKVIVTRQRPFNQALSSSQLHDADDEMRGMELIAIRTLSDYIPVEKFMKFLSNDGKSPFEFELAHGKFTLADFNTPTGSDDILEKTLVITKMQEAWKKKGSYQYERYRQPSKGTRITLDMVRSNNRKDFLSFGSNDYLGFASHPEVIQAAKDALDEYGVGATGSAVSSGLSLEHKKLNNQLAGMFQKESSLLYNSGYTANVGIIGALCKDRDLVLYDKICHTSIQDGIIFATANGATCIPFKHNDPAHLESLLLEHRNKYNGCLVVTEGIFSMDGDIAALSEIVPVSKRYNARIFLDSAHDFGVIGENGLGAAEYHSVITEIDLIMGTFSKIAGGIGGFVVGTHESIEYLRMMSRPHIFSVSMPPSMAAAATKALQIFASEKEHLNTLKANIRFFVKGLRALGVPMSATHQSSICPVLVGDESKLEIMTGILYENGIHTTPVVYPVVSRSKCRFRFTVTALHTQSDLDYALLVLKMAFEKVGLHSVKNAA